MSISFFIYLNIFIFCYLIVILSNFFHFFEFYMILNIQRKIILNFLFSFRENSISNRLLIQKL
jgi:hypothetical protein